MHKLRSKSTLLVLLFAITNAVLYSCMLPLWEGFDEPFHYAYVQSLSVDHRLPVLRHSYVSLEIFESLAQTPLSFILKRVLPGTIAFQDWSALPRVLRREREEAIAGISPQLKNEPSTLLNYEAQQTPLAYLILAPFDMALSRVDLRRRILILRLIVAISSTILLFFACQVLCDGLAVSGPLQTACMMAIFETQIVWAGLAHVANDWLAIAAAAWFFAMLVQVVRNRAACGMLVLSFVVAVGLLAKAYFLAFVPVFIAVVLYQVFRFRKPLRDGLLYLVVPAVIAGPWYLRNLYLYGSPTGMQEIVGGVGSNRILRAAIDIDWPRTIVESARWSLWTGNESHLSFSQHTLDLILVSLLACFVLLIWRYRQSTPPEYWTLAGSAVFVGALFYDLCVAWADTHGLQTTTGPYYAPCIVPAIWVLAFLGLQRNGLAGRIVAAFLSLLTAWVAALTYVAKLLPYYGGFYGRSTLHALWAWWRGNPKDALSGLTLARVPVVFVLLSLYLLGLIGLTASLLVRLGSTENKLTG